MGSTNASLIDLLPTYIYWLDKNGKYKKCNFAFAKLLNFTSSDEIINKQNCELACFKFNPDIYSLVDNNNKLVLQLKKSHTFEEIFYELNGQPFKYISIKTPTYDTKGNTTGISVISIKHSDLINNNTLTINQIVQNAALDNIINLIPCHIYWKDTVGRYLGCNNNLAHAIGFNSRDEILGKSDFDLPWTDNYAAIIRSNDIEVMNTKMVKTTEEPSIFYGQPATVLSQKVPLLDESGNMLGVIGASMDITNRKNLELKFKKIVDQMVHDIGSPIASLSMLVSTCENIPEETRIGIRESLTNIIDITRKVLNEYRTEETNQTQRLYHDRQPLIVSSTLLQILRDKKAQYHDKAIKFDYKFAKNSSFAFIEIDPSSFKRMISNIINNSVDAIKNQEGTLIVTLDANEQYVTLSIIDNGDGIKPRLLDKIKKGINCTEGKKDGHGIGLAQVRDTLHSCNGKFNIESQFEAGTTVTLNFPRINAPAWIAEKLYLSKGDIVVVLDDDSSIHTAWNTYLRAADCDISLKHFSIAEETLEFIEKIENKEKIVLLSDYELLNQKLNGLDVIKQTKINRTILVTSHHSNQDIKNQAIEIGTKILPKRLASEIEIVVSDYNLFENIP